MRKWFVAVVTVVLCTALTVQTQSPQSVGDLVKAMTLDEKLSMLNGATDPTSYGQAGYVPGVPRLGIPPLRLVDGPAGIRVTLPATALPAPVGMASTFSPELAKQYGQIIGRDARARHQNVVLAPMVNIVRVPQAGRNFETLGEDPLLASRLVAAEIEGLQGEGTIATVKHFAFNNQENARNSVSADVDEFTGHEIELPAFEAAVNAGVGAVMSSYNKVNGTHASENPWILTDILRKEWGFKGFVMSDWGGTHSGAPAVKAGQEMEMPRGTNYSTLPDALKKGEIDQATIDQAVTRILTAMQAAGLIGPNAAKRDVPEIPVTNVEAQKIATAGAVLLKNNGNILPLVADDLAALAVIGPTAKTLLIGGGGSAHVTPMRSGSPLDVLTQRAGASAKITYVKGYDVEGEPVPADVLAPKTTVDFRAAKAFPAGSAYTWTGTVTGKSAGEYVFVAHTTGGRASVSLGSQVAPAAGAGGGAGAAAAAAAAAPAIPGFGASALLPSADGMTLTSSAIRLEAGKATPISVTVTGRGTDPVQIRLAWISPEVRKARIDEAVAAARSAKTAVVFAYDEGTEGRDRASLSLPGYQNELIEAVAAANPRTVVVLNNGAPILMPWADRVAAILQMWYPGQEGAEATAAVLLGEAEPGGRLPVTFPKRAEDAPTAMPQRYPGVDGKGAYSEGIYVGYRWYDKEKIEPLFAFGHGLSYTTFTYSGLGVKAKGDGYDVTFTIKNTGRREGTDIPQVYLGPTANPAAPMAVKKLVGFERVTLAPGKSRKVTVHVDARGLSYWSTATHSWTVAAGTRTFMVGSSAQTVKLQKAVQVKAAR